MKQTKLTKKQFAAAIGISPQNLNHHLKSDKAPPLGDVDAWITFLAGQGRDGNLPRKLREEIAKARLKLIHQQVAKAKMENDVARRELIPFATVNDFIRHITANLFFGELSRLACEFPATLKGKDEISINAEVETQIARVKKSLEQQVQAWVEKKGKN